MENSTPEIDAVVVGAGFGGLYMVHKLRGFGFSVQGFERGGDVGGTWYWNRYPGARCDVESLDYSFSFDPALEQEWEWTERFATQPEIQRYLSHVADRFDLRRSFRFGTAVAAARWSAADIRWRVQTEGGDALSARFLILATGSLSAAKTPDIEGLADFAGQVLHTPDWPADADVAGKRVGVIGTGSSGIQAIPMIAKQAAALTVFQRTPSFTVPARNAPLPPEQVAEHKRRYRALRAAARDTGPGTLFRTTGKRAMEHSDEEREAAYAAAWEHGGPGFPATMTDTILDPESNRHASDFVRRKIAATVRDPDVAASLTPTDYPLGSKRVAVDTDYYETFNRDNVTLKDLRRTPLLRVVADGVELADGVVALDVLVLAIGFDAMTGSFTRIDITGEGGETLKEKWAAGPLTYLGLMSSGFPNLFMIAGPGSPSVLSNMVLSAEQHVEWIADCLMALRDRDLARIDATPDAEAAWVTRVNAAAAKTLYMQGNSWYVGANVPGKPRVFMPFIGGVHTYRRICDEVVANDYAGFVRS